MYRLDKKILEKMKAGKKIEIVAFGDSVTEGSYVKKFGEERCYVEIWEEKLKAKFLNPNIKVINKGIDGAVSRDGYNSLYQVVPEKPDLMTVMFGHNDREIGGDPKVYEEYVGEVVLGFRRFTKAQVLLLTPNALLDKRYDRKTVPYLKVLKRVGKELKVELADIHEFFERKFAIGLKREVCYYTYQDFLRVGYGYIDKEELRLHVIVHPNQKGHELIAEALMGV
jgi:lysophospholipase L1-like esterase